MESSGHRNNADSMEDAVKNINNEEKYLSLNTADYSKNCDDEVDEGKAKVDDIALSGAQSIDDESLHAASHTDLTANFTKENENYIAKSNAESTNDQINIKKIEQQRCLQDNNDERVISSYEQNHAYILQNKDKNLRRSSSETEDNEPVNSDGDNEEFDNREQKVNSAILPASDEELRRDSGEEQRGTSVQDHEESSSHAIRIEIEDSLEENHNVNDSIESATVVINTTAEDDEFQTESALVKDVENTTNEANEKVNSLRVVSISDDESANSEPDEHENKQNAEIGEDKFTGEDQSEEVINIDDESPDEDEGNSVVNTSEMQEEVPIGEDSKETECITINEDSEESQIEDNDKSADIMEIDENNSLHSDEEMQRVVQTGHQEQLNGVDETSNEGLQIDIADDDEDSLRSTQNASNFQDQSDSEDDNRQSAQNSRNVQEESEDSNDNHRFVEQHNASNLQEESQDDESRQSEAKLESSAKESEIELEDPEELHSDQQNYTSVEQHKRSNSLSNDDSLINSIKRQILKNEQTTEVPKLNGDHKNLETDPKTNSVIDIPADFSPEANKADKIPLKQTNEDNIRNYVNVDKSDHSNDDSRDHGNDDSRDHSNDDSRDHGDPDNSDNGDRDNSDHDGHDNSDHDDHENSDHDGHGNSGQNDHYHDHSNKSRMVDDHPEEVSQHSEGNVCKSPRQTIQNDPTDDEASRFSMASSASSSSATSSSHQLVIDHPTDDVETPAAMSDQSRVLPTLKISLKRKLSQNSDTSGTSPQHKLPHLEFNDEDNDKPINDSPSKLNEQSHAFKFRMFNGDNQGYLTKESAKDCLPSEAIVSGTIQASLTLKQLENEEDTKQSVTEMETEQPAAAIVSEAMKTSAPMETSEFQENFYEANHAATQSPARSSPLLNSLLLSKKSKHAEKFVEPAPFQTPNKTKYLCFNCKAGSYDTLTDLNEHQRSCLANKTLLPAFANSNTDTAIAPHTPPLSPDNSLSIAVPFTAVTEPLLPLEKKRYYQCSSCGTFHENWSLFLHIRETHKRHTCLYCIRMFPTAEKLSLHLEIKHDLEQNHFNSEETLRKSIELVDDSAGEARFLMCCTCQHVFQEHEHFSDHVCTEYMQECTLCGQKGRHTNQCKAQNEAKRSKVKKKSKGKDSMNAASLPQKSSPHFVAPAQTEKEIAPNISNMLSTNCDKEPSAPSPVHASHQLSTSTPIPMLPLQHQQLQQFHTEDSNSSSNMVIDETCNSTNYTRTATFNPFNAANERGNLEHQSDVSQPVLPPDRIQTSEQVAEKPAPIEPLIVPKFKLRVPKEFQKSVDAVISSTESEEDDEVAMTEEDADNISSHNTEATLSTTPRVDVENESLTELTTEVTAAQDTTADISKPNLTLDDDDSLDEPNSNLVRILQEIERTKLDIMRTKETLHTTSKPPTATPRLATISQSSSRTGDRNWSPTPPASPNSQWYTPRRVISQSDGSGVEMEHKRELSSLLLPPPPPLTSALPVPPLAQALPAPIQQQERRNTTGSDVDMDIDETISGHPTQCIERSTIKALDCKDIEEHNSLSSSTADDKQKASLECTDPTYIDVVNISNATLDELAKPVPLTTVDDQQPMDIDEAAKIEPLEQQKPPLLTEHQNIAVGVHLLPPPPPPPLFKSVEADDKPDKSEIDVCFDEEKSEEDREARLKTPQPPADGVNVADEETLAVDLMLDRPLEKFEIIEFVRICLKAVYPLCLYCNHARRIAVNGKSLVLHLIGQHRFAATVDSITAEELKPDTIVAKLKSYMPALEEHYFNSNSYCTIGDGAFTHHFNERIFECFQCRFVTSTHKELYLHNRKMHLKTAILCFMCRANFFSFSEILCHVCPGEPHKMSVFDVKFRCCLCDVDNIPSPFRLMVHLRKKHSACDICLEDCRDQGKLSSHVWKHKLHHLCYRCGIAYRNKMDITKHLFWKHGTESIICKRCLQKRWRHVYHFCVPPSNFVCEICNLCFSKATYLKVHKRIHTGDLRYPCTDENCEHKFISRRLLLKHTAEHQLPEIAKAEPLSNSGDLNKGNTELLLKPQSELKAEDSLTLKEEKIDVKIPSESEENSAEKKADTKSDDNVQKEISDTVALKTPTAALEDGTLTKPRKKKKSKRNKESLEDLNLIAPNLSESDSSDDSDVESKSKSGDDSLVPKVMLSPASETENYKDDDPSTTKDKTTGKVLDIWKNFLQAQGVDAGAENYAPVRDATEYTEDYYPTPQKLHVAQSDHDYCVMFKPEPPKPVLAQAVPTASPHKRKTAKSPRRTSARRSNASSGASSSWSSGTSSDSSCSCGSNCSCSSSNSDSSSCSSSSSADSSTASHTSKKRHRKKSDRDRMRKKSQSMSPMKKHGMSESGRKARLNSDVVNVGTEDTLTLPAPREPTPPNEPLFYESDLETAESDTDEEFYDEHPQKLATELLAQKRAQLIAQTRLSPSHNYDIVENSRPSTPSLPDEVTREKKVKLKKKKRDRKSTSRSTATVSAVPTLKLNIGIIPVQEQQLPIQQHVALTTPSYDTLHGAPSNISDLAAGAQQQQHLNAGGSQLTPLPIGMYQHHAGRISEGSSCSDADASLKRSKRARRPNKFYGYTSDEEHNASGLGQPLMIGMRAIKPQPPPQLTWRKEDLPTPSKSIINNINRIKTPRTPKTPNTQQNLTSNLFGSNLIGPSAPSTHKKMRAPTGEKTKNRKRLSKKLGTASKLPPIPTLKIRPSQIGLTQSQLASAGGGTNHIPASQIYSSSKESDDDDDADSTESSSDDESQQLSLNSTATTSTAANVWNVPGSKSMPPQPPANLLVLPTVPPAPPQAVAFNQKIPPALLPNPDFATLQYFKANNIRYPIRPPAGARQARDGESVYCYCRCPYDEVSEMIACDGDNCLIEWFHFECVGIMVAPQGKWFCAECRPKYSEELYPSGTA